MNIKRNDNNQYFTMSRKVRLYEIISGTLFLAEENGEISKRKLSSAINVEVKITRVGTNLPIKDADKCGLK